MRLHNGNPWLLGARESFPEEAAFRIELEE
jgi:hypothetical protein